MSGHEGSAVTASPVTLIKKTITRLSFDGTPREGTEERASGDINLSISVMRPGRPEDERDTMEATLLVRTMAAPDAPFYSFEAEVRGIYDVTDADGPDEEVMLFIERRGMEELYDYFKFVMSVLTCEGAYGQVLLPTIAVMPGGTSR